MRKTLLVVLLLCGLVPARATPSGGVVVADAYVRAVPPGQPNSAAFMVLDNRGGEPRALVAATSPVAEVVELHTHDEAGGMMRMRRIERIELPAGESVRLAPGGLHVMLIGLRQPLSGEVPVTLELELDDGTRIEVEAPVRAPAAGVRHHAH
ncbi:copper chaperone PCu(A)C [Marichromatium bheemlicum]|uniref:Copper chaperone PCu(A)C n=1 Tax=Marichromatium bheemlicum TaxID=365339 RepID=A0ABX1I5I2_9GAMM|nr:copper chaperone PCu(A)C [Marichromatium bheemlicum]NKN32840.1 copper chaperone PCu(A)C [Marichromatium bheemlicum]